MKLSSVKRKLSAKEVIVFDVLSNPGNLEEWIILIREQSGKSHFLVNEDESVIRSKDANEILSLLKYLGVKNVHVSL